MKLLRFRKDGQQCIEPQLEEVGHLAQTRRAKQIWTRGDDARPADGAHSRRFDRSSRLSYYIGSPFAGESPNARHHARPPPRNKHAAAADFRRFAARATLFADPLRCAISASIGSAIEPIGPFSNYHWLLVVVMPFGPILLDLQGFYQSPLTKTRMEVIHPDPAGDDLSEHRRAAPA